MKKLWIGTIAAVMAVMTAAPAYAGTWVSDPARPALGENGITNWWYRNDDGSYPADGWYWLDGNQDGWSECYRFDENGWMYASTKVQGFEVDGSGAWMINGQVQRLQTAADFGNFDESWYSDTDTSASNAPEYGIDHEWAMECFDLINAEREKHGAEPLLYSEELQEVCDIRAEEIAESFSHTRPSGESCFTAMEEAGISYRKAGENIAAGQRSAAEAVDAWMNSKGHRENILNKKFEEAAIGFYRCADGYGYYWVQMFMTQ